MDLPGPHTSVLEYASVSPHAGFPSRVCLITLSNSLFAIDLQSIREVFPVDSVTPVPGMPTVLTGVTNCAGSWCRWWTCAHSSACSIPARP